MLYLILLRGIVSPFLNIGGTYDGNQNKLDEKYTNCVEQCLEI